MFRHINTFSSQKHHIGILISKNKMRFASFSKQYFGCEFLSYFVHYRNIQSDLFVFEHSMENFYCEEKASEIQDCYRT